MENSDPTADKQGDWWSTISTAAAEEDTADHDPGPSYSSRLLSVTSGLLRIHLEVAQREAARDQQRLFRGLFCLAIGSFFLLLTLVVLQVVATLLLRALGLRLLSALGAVGGADLIFGLLLFVVGRRTLRGPVLPQTRAVLRRTWAALRSP